MNKALSALVILGKVIRAIVLTVIVALSMCIPVGLIVLALTH